MSPDVAGERARLMILQMLTRSLFEYATGERAEAPIAKTSFIISEISMHHGLEKRCHRDEYDSQKFAGHLHVEVACHKYTQRNAMN